jgi:hypothetical protein
MNLKGNRKFYAYGGGMLLCSVVALLGKMSGDYALVVSVIAGGFFGGNSVEHYSKAKNGAQDA